MAEFVGSTFSQHHPMVCTVNPFFQIELIKKNGDNVTSTIGMLFLPYRYYEPQLYGRRSVTTRKRGAEAKLGTNTEGLLLASRGAFSSSSQTHGHSNQAGDLTKI